MRTRLTDAELRHLRAELIEHGEVHAEREHLAQIRGYLRQQQLSVEVNPSVIGIRITLKAVT